MKLTTIHCALIFVFPVHIVSICCYDIPIGVVYDHGDQDELKDAVRLAADQYAKHLYLRIDQKRRDFVPPRRNSFYLEQDVCSVMAEGIFGLFNFGSSGTYPVLNAISQTFRLPYFNWNTAHSLSPDMNHSLELNLKPPIYEAVADWLIGKEWTNFTYLYDKPEAISNIQRINDIINEKRGYTVSAAFARLDLQQQDMYSFLFRFQQSRSYGPQRVILDLSDSQTLKAALDVLANITVGTGNIHYFIASFDFTSKYLNQFKSSLVNITGFRLLNNDANVQFRSFLPEWQKRTGRFEISPEAAFAYDSVQLFVKALELLMESTNYTMLAANFRNGRMYNRDMPGLICNTDGHDVVTFEHGAAIAYAAKQVDGGDILQLERETVFVKLDGLSGHIELDDRGRRKSFHLDFYELSFSGRANVISTSMYTASHWQQGKGFSNDSKTSTQRYQPKGKASSKRRKIITTVLVEPFVMLKKARSKETLSGNDRYEGFCVDLMKLLSEKIDGFQYEIRIVKDGKHGGMRDNGTWNGMIGELLTGDADLVVASLTITKARERVVDFSKPFLTLGISIMIKKPEKQEFSVFSFMSPLSSEIWMYIIFAYLGVSVVLFLVSRFSPIEWRIEESPGPCGLAISNDFSVYNCLWFTLAAFMQQGTDILPRSISGRIASSAWWFFTMIIVSSYTANLAAFLTLEKMQTPIESVEDLAKQTKIKYGIQDGGSTAEFFRDSAVETYSRMWQFMSSQHPSVFVSNYAEGIKRVRESKGRYAFLLESTANVYTSTRKPCDTMKVGQHLNSVGYGVATPLGSDMKDLINLAILELQEKGELKKLENKWWYDKGECEPAGAQDSQSASLNLSKVAGIFYILIGGMLIAMLAAFGEFLYRSKLESRKSNKKMQDTMKSQFETFVRGEAKHTRLPTVISSYEDGYTHDGRDWNH